MRPPLWICVTALLLACHGASGALVPWGSSPGSWEPWIQLDLLATNSLRCTDFYANADAAFRSAFTYEVNRKLLTFALTDVSTDCQVMTEAVPGRRGASVALPQKRLRIRGKLVTSAEEGDMRHILAVFEAIQIHKQIIHEISHTLPEGSVWAPDALFYATPLQASLCVGGMWAAGAPLQIGKPCPLDGQAWNPRTLIKNGVWNEPGRAPPSTATQGFVFGPANANDLKLWPLGPSGGPNFKLASFAGRSPDAPDYKVIDLSNVAQWGGIGGMTVWPRTGCGYDQNRGFGMPTGSKDFRQASSREGTRSPASQRALAGATRCAIGDCWSNNVVLVNGQNVTLGARDGSCMWQNLANKQWVQTGGVAPKPLLEFTFARQADGSLLTYYDLSAVDGYVGSMAVFTHKGVAPNPKNVTRFTCGSPVCDYDLSKCPPELRLYYKDGSLIGCMSISSGIDRLKDQKVAKYRATYRQHMLELRQNAYTRSQAQCACVHASAAPGHPSYDCALDKAGVNGNYEDSLINKPPNAKSWKPNYKAAAAALANNHTTPTKPTRLNLGNNIDDPKPITATGFCCSPYVMWYYGPNWVNNKDGKYGGDANNDIIKQHMCNDTSIPSPWEAGWRRTGSDPDYQFMLKNYKGKKYHEIFKGMCGDAYSWQFDDLSSTYECVVGAQTSYIVEFC
ncbi:pathogenesis-related 5-like [Chlorella sorokiniana]|uniref:Pathogenesis-related 5-like n=1 Tax=Chlorella sorokiniana TaxID=3076 RepID=A0A2P6TC84_CHLSO|nr:pathogenesis-related 5-like [Chlorella sorokiniana]|eukprot:PRW20243.1 pathogenesis-related 5-like [Chlorella sorokiniana]